MTEIELGDRVRDLITGYEGIAVAKTVFINGCVQFSVAKQLKKGEKLDPNVIGEPQIDSKSLKIVKKKAVDLEPKVKKEKKTFSGGATRITKRMRGY
jgi:hypothetical protein